MKAEIDPVGLENNHHICEQARHAVKVVAAWGTHGSHMERDKEVMRLLESIGCASKVICLKRTKAGHPSHPLYIAAETVPEPFACRT